MKKILKFGSLLLLGLVLVFVFLLISVLFLSGNVFKKNGNDLQFQDSILSIETFGVDRYECTGSCFCEEYDRRSSYSGLAGKSGLTYVFAAVSSVFAYSMARDYFSEECNAQFLEDISCSEVRSEVESCSGFYDEEDDNQTFSDVDDEELGMSNWEPDEEKPEKCVLCIGDSMTEGYSSVDPETFHPYSEELQNLIDKDSKNYNYVYKVSSFGVTGECTQKMLPRCQDVFNKMNEETDVSHVIIFGGLIDCIMDQEEADHAVGNLQCMYTHCLKKKDDVLVFSVQLPTQEFDWFEKNKRGTLGRKKEYNDKLKAVCDESERIYLVDLGEYPEMSEEEKKKYWEDDKLHYSPDGYDMVARKIYKVLKDNL